MKTAIICNTFWETSKIRLDASFYLSEGSIAKVTIDKSIFPLEKIKTLSNKVFYGGRSRRIYVSDHKKGLPFISSSDMLLSDLSKVKFVSKRHTSCLKDTILEKDWILVSRSGTIGNTVYTNEIFAGKSASEHIIRVLPNNKIAAGFLYAYLASKYGYALLTKGTFGAVVQHIEPEQIENISVPLFPPERQKEINDLVLKSASLRVQVNHILADAELTLKCETGLDDLTSDGYDYYGPRSIERKVSIFYKNINEVGGITFNAFNHSIRITNTINKVKATCQTIPLINALDKEAFFSTGSFPRIEVKPGKGIMLINQSDIFDRIIKGKSISKRKIKTDTFANYGEILIAGVGTLGENELFCRVVFANEDIKGQLVSGEFIRMKTNQDIPPGYLFIWLNSDYGFRLIRSTHSGSKQCRPIHKLLMNIPIPIIKKTLMNEIHNNVVNAHTLRHQANVLELEAIQLIEKEIDQWQI